MGCQSFSPRKLRRLGLAIVGFMLAVAIATGPAMLPAPGSTQPVIYQDTATGVNASSSDPLTEDKLAAGRHYYAAGQFADAIRLWQAAAQEAAQQGNLTRQVMSWNGLSNAYQQLSDWSQAQQASARSLALLEATPTAEAILWAQTLNTQASLLFNQGNQAETALRTWEQAEAYYHQAGDTAGAIGCQINQAQVLQSLGFYRRATQQLDAIQLQLNQLPNSDIKIAGLRSLGKALQLIGNPYDSYDVLAQSLAIATQLNATSELSSILLSIGKLAAEIGDPERAVEYFQAAEDQAQTPLDQLQARLDRLAIDVNQGNWAPIPQLSHQIHQQLTTLPPSRTTLYGTVNFAGNLSQLPSRQRPLSAATLNQLLADAVQAAKTLQDSRAEAYALQQMGRLYQESQQRADAIDLTQQALALAKATQATDVTAQAAWQLGKLFKQQQQLSQAIAAYTDAVTALQSLRGDLAAINQDIQFSYREQVEPVYRELVGLLLEENSQDSLTQARNVLESLQLAELDNFFREACLNVQANQIDQIDPNATVIYSIILPDRVATIYSRAGQPLQVYASPVDQATLESTVKEFLASLHPSSDRRQRLHYARQLYDWLIYPAESAQALTPDQTLVFVLDGKLRSIPMAALYDGNQYLIEKYAVALSPGLQLMQAHNLKTQNIHAIVGGISETRSGFSQLPAVQAEVENISRLLPSTSLLNDQFTREALAQNLTSSQADVVHLATHGQFSSDFNNTFFLTWDGVININELSEILQNRETRQGRAIELLTLSACETATGDDRATLGLAGLAVRSGARSTIATLWPIKDNVAEQIMTTFYQYLRQPQISKAEALRQAQLSVLHDTDFEDPFFWSAYVLIGNWL